MEGRTVVAADQKRLDCHPDERWHEREFADPEHFPQYACWTQTRNCSPNAIVEENGKRVKRIWQATD